MFETRPDCRPKRANAVIGVDIIDMENIKNKIILIDGKKVSDKEQSYVKSYVNIMFTKISANKRIKVFVQ